jgi:phage shock protein PspC (stress-responsive transcriptional regulator)
MLGGVCSGLAAYFGLDPTLVRIVFVLLALGTGFGVFLYLLLWIVVPAEGAAPASPGESVGEQIGDRARDIGHEIGGALSRPNPRLGAYFGLALIGLGLIWLANSLDVPWLRWLDFDILWPTLLIVGGIVVILRRARGN